MIRQANVVDDVTSTLALGDSIHTGNCLKQVVVFDLLVDVHYLLDGSVESGEQHVADNQKCNSGVFLVWIIEVECFLKALDCVDFTGVLACCCDDSRLVGSR